MPGTERSPTPPGPGAVRTTTTTYSYRRAWLPLLLAAIAVPLIVAAIAVATRRGHIQGDLSTRARTALAAAGIPNAQVSFNGRDATIRGVPATSADAARKAVLHLRGVRVATVATSEHPAPAAPSATVGSSPPVAAPGPLRIAESGDQITLSGTVPDQATGAALVRAATQSAPGQHVVDQLTIAAGSAPSAQAGAERDCLSRQ